MRISTLAVASAFAASIVIPTTASAYDTAAGYWVGGTLNLSPFFNASYERDDNPNSMRKYTKESARRNGMKKQTDTADTLVLKGGLNFLMPGNHWRLDGRAFVDHERSSGADVDDRTDFYEAMTLKGWTDGDTTWFLSENYQDIRYDDEFELSQDDRKVLTLSGGGDMAITDKSKITLGAGYTEFNYDDKTNYDYSRVYGKLGFAHVLTEKTDWTLSTLYRNYDKDGYDSNAWSIDGRIGLRTRSTDKLTFDTSIGVEHYRDYKYSMYDAAGNYLGKKSKGNDENSFVYSIAGNWKMAQRLSLRVSGNAEYEPAQDVNDNSLLEETIAATLTYTPGDHWKLTGGIAYERDEYNRKIVQKMDKTTNPYTSVERGGKDRNDDEMRFFANVSYSLTRYCSLFVNWRYTDVSSSISGYEYDRTRYGAGISLKY